MKSTTAPDSRFARALTRLCGQPAALLTIALWGALLLGYLGLHGWPFDLFANFRVQYMGLFAVCVIALTIARWRKTAILALLGVALTTASMAAYFPERVIPEHERARGFTLVSFNTWFRNEHLDAVLSFLETSEADAIVLQEVELSRVEEMRARLRAYPYVTVTPGVRRGLVIFSRTPLTDVHHFRIPERVTRITRAQTRWNGRDIVLIGVHLSWPLTRFKAHQRSYELAMLAEQARRETSPVLVAGDFNLTPWSQRFTEFVDRSGLQDCAIGQGLLPTWPAQFMPLRIRIDHCFASSHWRVQQVRVGPQLGSDHLPVITNLELTN